MRADILMADEPTGSLDHATGQAVMDLMFELNREIGTTLILVTTTRRLPSAAPTACASRPGKSLPDHAA